ncbi:MAG TPA: zinc-binding alcohol dehydrogenase family protein [Nocardioides sp.]|uniref:quinone oxidoreductase family protein n=1 Tax=uncultured Nocardioides sp. TaxID=198441 RepID=UPI000EE54E9A|nr:zinc-binding alcohol dehydrogenase family protein [uncultured Nocardioides sp.]HCB04823.1 hypothetical protein [Nocardioides sp.]HRD62162.1 zinc-binding alcohol dehydrogenase family protein [Nocardioides sp.]HRI94790.1 zinc-binding alcohol dehydrogenase family protein [Nocardioides sp.]HRK45154.1 zinc-binding alcohol dehydrogenase family protein [Nocardioides sp.]
MQAVVVDEFGPPNVLTHHEVADPEPGPRDVLVRIGAVGVNRADLLARAGQYYLAGPPPLVLGLEAAGEVVKVGSEVTGLGPGVRVVTRGATNAPGFYAELAAVPATSCVVIPEDVTFEAACCLPTAWLSAWYCLHTLAGIRPTDRVLVHAAASGVGSAAIQIARDAGARVVATASTRVKVAWAIEQGASVGIATSDLDGSSLANAVRDRLGGEGPDVVLDSVGGPTFAESLRAVGYGGRVVALGNVAVAPTTLDTRDFYPKNLTIHGFQITTLMGHGYDPGPDLNLLLEALRQRRFVVPIAARFELRHAAEAHRMLEDRTTMGKVVLVP